MYENDQASSLLSLIEKQNPAVAIAFREFRSQGDKITTVIADEDSEATNPELHLDTPVLIKDSPELHRDLLNPYSDTRFELAEEYSSGYAGLRGNHERLTSEYRRQHFEYNQYQRQLDEINRQSVYSERANYRLRTNSSLHLFWWGAAFGVFVGGLSVFAFFVGPRFIKFLGQNWMYFVFPIAGIIFSGGLVLLTTLLNTKPLANVPAPDTKSEEPLAELKLFAERSASRLHAAFRIQICITVIIGIIFVILIAWSMIMISEEKILYASVFGSSGIVMAILSRWKWQPFDRINEARRLADNADALTTGLRLRMQSISGIKNPKQRAKSQWEAVSEYLAQS